MQSAFVDIVSDGDHSCTQRRFRKPRSYIPDIPHEQPQSAAPSLPAAIGAPVKSAGRITSRATGHHDEPSQQESHPAEDHHFDESTLRKMNRRPRKASACKNVTKKAPPAAQMRRTLKVRTNASPIRTSAPQNSHPLQPHTELSVPRRERSPGQNFSRSNDLEETRRRPRARRPMGRRGEEDASVEDDRRRPGGGRNLPPSKYASPQGGESRGSTIAEASRVDTTPAPRTPPRPSSPTRPQTQRRTNSSSRRIVGEISRKPAQRRHAALVEHEVRTAPEVEESTSRGLAAQRRLPKRGVPRRFSGGLPAGCWPTAARAAAADAGGTATPMEEAYRGEHSPRI